MVRGRGGLWCWRVGGKRERRRLRALRRRRGVGMFGGGYVGGSGGFDGVVFCWMVGAP